MTYTGQIVIGGAGSHTKQPFGCWNNPVTNLTYVTDYYYNQVYCIDSTSVIATIPVGSMPTEVYVLQDGSKAYVSNSDPAVSSVSVIDCSTNTVIATIVGPTGPRGIGGLPYIWGDTFEKAHEYVYVCEYDGGAGTQLTIIDPTSDTIVGFVPVADGPLEISFLLTYCFISHPSGNGYTFIDFSLLSTIFYSGIPTPIGIACDLFTANQAIIIGNGDNSFWSIANTGIISIGGATGGNPQMAASVNLGGNFTYYTNEASNDVRTSAGAGGGPVGRGPIGICTAYASQYFYICNSLDGTVSVMYAPTNTVVSTVTL